MNKLQFLDAVRSNAASVPPEELAALLDYYTEMIDEAMDEGLSEEDAVARLGSWDEICEQIHAYRAEPPLVTAPITKTQPETQKENNANPNPAPAEEPAKTKKWNRISLPTWAVILLILTSPVWGTVVLSLLIVLFAVVASLVIIGGALVISLFAVVVALAVVGVVGIPAAFVLLVTSSAAPFLLLFGSSLICLGLAILGVFVSVVCFKLFSAFVRWLFGRIRGCFQ